MAQTTPPKSLTATRANELREDTVTTAATRGTEFFEDHRNAVIGVIVGIVVLSLAVIAWRAYQANRSAEGQQLLGAILTEYEAGNLQTALDGTDTMPGLLEIADQYGSTSTGEQATFFAADALYELGQTDRALELFEDYDGDGLLAASAIGGQAAILEEQGENDRAARLYELAATEYSSPASTPGYLLDAARAYAAAGDPEAAEAALTRIIDDWETAPEVRSALVELGQVQAQASATGTPTGSVTAAPAVADSAAAPEEVAVPVEVQE